MNVDKRVRSVDVSQFSREVVADRGRVGWTLATIGTVLRCVSFSASTKILSIAASGESVMRD